MLSVGAIHFEDRFYADKPFMLKRYLVASMLAVMLLLSLAACVYKR